MKSSYLFQRTQYTVGALRRLFSPVDQLVDARVDLRIRLRMSQRGIVTPLLRLHFLGLEELEARFK